MLTAVEQHIEVYGVSGFVVGGYGSFDRLAARAVIEAKVRYPQVKLTLLLPYHPEEQSFELSVGFDDSLFPSEMEQVPRRLAIVQANRYMIDHSDYLIAYVTHSASNAYNLLEYTYRRVRDGKIMVTNIADTSCACRQRVYSKQPMNI